MERVEASPRAHVDLPGSKQELADLLGTARVTINRTLSRMRRDGLVEATGGTAEVLAPELLALRAGKLLLGPGRQSSRDGRLLGSR